MYILDTDHLSVLERKGANAQPPLQRMREIDPAQISTTINSLSRDHSNHSSDDIICDGINIDLLGCDRVTTRQE